MLRGLFGGGSVRDRDAPVAMALAMRIERRTQGYHALAQAHRWSRPPPFRRVHADGGARRRLVAARGVGSAYPPEGVDPASEALQGLRQLGRWKAATDAHMPGQPEELAGDDADAFALQQEALQREGVVHAVDARKGGQSSSGGSPWTPGVRSSQAASIG
jgi:hypothetical protein